jgi:zinc transport system permease protein
MEEFFKALMDPDIPFLRLTLLAGILGSFSFGMVGTYVIVRRISYIAGAIAHSVLAGIGLSLYLKIELGIEWVDPMVGAVIAALASAVTIGFVSLYANQREDTVIGAIWAIGMAAGLLFMAATSGYLDPMSYLFGNILLISMEDILIILVLDALIIGIIFIFYNKFLAVCFDEEYARIRGLKVEIYYILLLCLIALTVVLMVRIVGIVLVIALLTLPAAIASQFSRKLWQMMIFAVGLCMLFVFSGLGVSYSMNLPAGPSIIIIAGFVYLLTALGSAIKKKTSKA